MNLASFKVLKRLDVTEVNKIWNEISMTLCPTLYVFFFMFMIFKRKSNREVICNTDVLHDLRICHDPEVRFMAISPTYYLCKGLFKKDKKNIDLSLTSLI